MKFLKEGTAYLRRRRGPMLVLVVIVGIWLASVASAASLIYRQRVAALNDSSEIVVTAYRAHVARSANIDKLLTDGRSQLSRGDYALAAVSFKQATLLDPNFRDSCLGWAYAAAMVAAKGDASDSEMSDARTALAKARQLDPTNPTVKQFEAVLANTQHHS